MMIYIAWSPPLPSAWVVSTPLTQLLNKQKSKHNERTFQAAELSMSWIRYLVLFVF